jgi:PHD/YefM family antitoxin component YafN of YafNO toxin-antitoxin module
VEYISFDQFEKDFDEIIARVVDDKVHYQITTDGGFSVVLVPIESYTVLAEVYDSAFNQPMEESDGPYTQEGGT